MDITIKDLKNGRDFWKWVLKDPDNNNWKHMWPEYERIRKYSNACPLCEITGTCKGCPMEVRGIKCHSHQTDNPYGIWREFSSGTEARTQAAETILQVYNEEVERMKSETRPNT